MENKRIEVFDVIKGIAVLLMIQVHITELIAAEKVFDSVFGTVSLFFGAVPVAPAFMFVLGYFLARSKKTTKQLIKRGLIILCLGYVLNIALNFNLIVSVYFGRFETDILPFLFGVDILHFAGLSIMAVALLKYLFEKNMFILIFIALISAFLGQYLKSFNTENVILKYVLAHFYGATWWSYFPLFPWLAYPLAGIIYFKVQKESMFFNRLPKIIQTLGIVVLFLALFFTLGYSVKISSNLSLYYHHGIIYFLWAMTFIIGYVYLAKRFIDYTGENQLLRFLKWTGKNVTLIYFVQWIIIGNIATEVYQSIELPLYLFMFYVLIPIISCALVYFILKLRENIIKKRMQTLFD